MANTGDILEKLISFIYDEYNRRDVFKSHGEAASVVVSQFSRNYGIRLGDAGAQLEYIRLLRKNGWIEVVALDGSSTPRARLFSFSRIKPTPEGIQHVEERRKPGRVIKKATSDAAEITGRFLKGFLGR
ncbi:hypothetical protein B1772_01180 [Dehalococcoides mccartyi]|jgi:hypothetical protein|uniref:hypothetical protein n=1 Tax=Dehalococcoides mccartyi TaxID=61435 RepID=UPI0009A490F4|nr:hypothetical protein [Dehalococcoides mccartyi]AQY72714.1 hypothetical protein B1772_01180 [Dehalococcoides mccartyi]